MLSYNCSSAQITQPTRRIASPVRHFFVIAGGTLSGKKKRRRMIAIMIVCMLLVMLLVDVYTDVLCYTIPKMKNPPEHLIPEGFGGEAGI